MNPLISPLTELEKTSVTRFSHLHCHSQYSVLQSPASVKALIKKAKKLGMSAVALTDLGNMFGIFSFVEEAHNEGIRPIVGCEFFLVEDRLKRKFTKDHRDYRTQVPLIAKNKTGYHNLVKLVSMGFMEGYYAMYPRIDKEVLSQNIQGLIATTGGLRGEIPDLILNTGVAQAEETFLWWKRLFGEDFYIELQRHGLPEEDHVNEVLLTFARKYDVAFFAANDVFYIDKKDHEAHDVLLCIKDGELQKTEIGRGRGKRFGFPNDEFYFKTAEEMAGLFSDLPEAISTTQEIVDKIEDYKLERDILLPEYKLPDGFDNQDDYLRHITYEGAKHRYPELTDAIRERIDHELNVIKEMGFPGYFLIVQDFTSKAKEIGVYVGPGRGSAAGSAVAFCIGITNIDPIKYDLLFERFLNPERVSMPDIDIDFDDEGRSAILDYVVNKYGRNQVAQIITYGKMGPKLAIRDVARVMDIPLSDADRVAKLVPERPGTDFQKAFSESPELKEIRDQDSELGKIVKQAEILEGSVRNTGVHACGVIIAPNELTNHVPLAVSKDSDLYVTQYDNKVVESAGLLKMDFLGLKTLSILKTAIENVELSTGKRYHLDDIPIDDPKTFELYQLGETVGTFQFESDGMRKYLKDLKPTTIDDLIAMNALYRPGPMQFIPNYINRRHGKEEVKFHHPLIEPLLKGTYGIMVYQEQIMQVAQVLAGYSLGGADILRRAMGKKKMDVMAKEKVKFIEGAKKKGVDQKLAETIFQEMEKFAQYGFNKSHSAAYSMVAYQTGFFKANFPAEYMAAVLTHNYGDIKKVMKFIEEANRMGIPVDPPNINTGTAKFTAKTGHIQYGMEAIKGVGSAAIEHAVEERQSQGLFKSIFDFASRVDLKICNRKTLESLISAGAFDTLHPNRAQLLSGLDDILQYGQKLKQEKELNQTNMFSMGGSQTLSATEPKLTDVEPWTTMQRLKTERELLGFFLSGHPMDRFKDECGLFCDTNLGPEGLGALDEKRNVSVAGIVTSVKRIIAKNGAPMAFVELEDDKGSGEAVVFPKTYDRFMNLLLVDNILFVSGAADVKSGKPKILADNIIRIEHLREENKEKLGIRIDIRLDELENEDLKALAQVSQESKGASRLYFDVYKNGAAPVKMHSRKYMLDCSEQTITALRKIVGDQAVRLEKVNL